MNANDVAILALAVFAMTMVILDTWRQPRPRSVWLDLAIIAIAMVPVVKRFFFQ